MKTIDRSSTGFGVRGAPYPMPLNILFAIIAGLAGCAEEKKPRAPTEQGIHSRDLETVSRVRGRHLYACDDKQPLFLDFKDERLTLELRSEERGPAQKLSAPSQGLQYEDR